MTGLIPGNKLGRPGNEDLMSETSTLLSNTHRLPGKDLCHNGG